MAATLAVDLGKTRCRSTLWNSSADAVALPERVGAPGLADRAGPALAFTAIAAAIETARARLDDPAQPISVGVGAAGALAAGPAAADLARRLAAHPGVGEACVGSDAVSAQVGALAGAAGVVLVAGTGAVALGIEPDRFERCDGWGPLLGDLGSGGWLGLAGLRAAMRDLDGRGPSTLLRRLAESSLNGSEPTEFAELAEGSGQLTLDTLPGLLGRHDNPARLAASFAPCVGRAAEAGDPVALELIAVAARELAASVHTVAARLRVRPVPVAIVGGLSRLGPVLLEPLERAWRSGPVLLAPQPAAGDALDGARLLATRRDTAAEVLVHRAVGPTPPRGVAEHSDA